MLHSFTIHLVHNHFKLLGLLFANIQSSSAKISSRKGVSDLLVSMTKTEMWFLSRVSLFGYNVPNVAIHMNPTNKITNPYK